MTISAWQEAAIEIAARQFPETGLGKTDREIWVSMRDEAVARLPIGDTSPKGWEKINIIGMIVVPKSPLIRAIMAMDDENFQHNMRGRYVIHIEIPWLENAHTVELGEPRFSHEGNYYSPDIDHLMFDIDCARFVNDAELEEIGGGVPPSSDFADAREEAQGCGEDPDDWVSEIMKVAESNIRASLRSIIIFDECIEPKTEIKAVLIDYRETV
jgi:hypothetical protein